MKINVLDENGVAVNREMTEEEKTELLTLPSIPETVKSPEERIAELEEAITLLIGVKDK